MPIEPPVLHHSSRQYATHARSCRSRPPIRLNPKYCPVCRLPVSPRSPLVYVQLTPNFSSTTPLVNGNPSSSSPSIAAIVGGVIGGIIGLVLLLLLVLLWINHRQRRASKEQGVTQSPDSPLQSRFSEDPFLSERRRRSAQPSWVAGSSASMLSRMPTTMPQHNRQQPVYDYTAPPPHTYNAVPPSHADDASTDVDRLTYYTLPSYHENVRQRPGARDLSEADVDAISRRLVEVMQGQVEQSGGDPNQLHGVVPPGNLIDHLVEEQLQPQAI